MSRVRTVSLLVAFTVAVLVAAGAASAGVVQKARVAGAHAGLTISPPVLHPTCPVKSAGGLSLSWLICTNG